MSFFCIKWRYSAKKNRVESTKKWIKSLKDNLFSDFNPSMEKKILSKDNQGKSANEIKKLTTLVFVRHNLEFYWLLKIWLRDSRSTSHFELLIFYFCTPFRTKAMLVHNRNIFYGKNRWSLNFCTECILTDHQDVDCRPIIGLILLRQLLVCLHRADVPTNIVLLIIGLLVLIFGLLPIHQSTFRKS